MTSDLEKTNNEVNRMFARGNSEDETATDGWDDKEKFIRHAFKEDSKKGAELLFKQYYKPLCNHAVRFVYAKEIAEDLVSDIFYTFWSKQLYLSVTTSFRAYLFISVRNRCIKHLKMEFVKGNALPVLMRAEHAPPTPHQVIQFNEFSAKIDKAIQSLPPQCQKIFLLNRIEGKKYKEIASELAISLKTVEAHMGRALEVLRRTVQEEYDNFR